MVLLLFPGAAFEHPLTSRRNPIASPIAHKTSRRRFRRQPPSDGCFSLFFLATIARSCVLCVTPFVLPAYSYARRWARRAAFGGSRVRPAAAVDSGKLRRASPASGVALSPTTSVVVVVARGDGEAAFVRPRVSVPPAEIGWNERARVREGSLCGGRKVCTPRVSAGFLLQLLRR